MGVQRQAGAGAHKRAYPGPLRLLLRALLAGLLTVAPGVRAAGGSAAAEDGTAAGSGSGPRTGAPIPDPAPMAEPVHRPEWVHVPASDPNIEFYMDRASIQEHQGEVEFWDVVIFRKPTQHDETSDRWIKEKRTLRRVRCAHGEQALIKGSSFDEQGHLIEAVQLPVSGAQFVHVHPGSVAASELYKVCHEAGLDAPAVLPGDGPPPGTGDGTPR